MQDWALGGPGCPGLGSFSPSSHLLLLLPRTSHTVPLCLRWLVDKVDWSHLQEWFGGGVSEFLEGLFLFPSLFSFLFLPSLILFVPFSPFSSPFLLPFFSSFYLLLFITFFFLSLYFSLSCLSSFFPLSLFLILLFFFSFFLIFNYETKIQRKSVR